MILQQCHTNCIPGEKIAPAQSIANPPFIVPEIHPSTRSLPQSHNPLSSLFIFSLCVRVIYSQVSFLWVITLLLGRGVSGVTQFLGLASLVFHLAIISSNRGPSHWYASYALAGHAASASLPLLVGRSLGSISGNGMYSLRRQLLVLAVQATPALQSGSHGLVLALMMLVYSEVKGLEEHSADPQ